MLCEYAYYENDSKRARLNCNNEKKMAEDKTFKDRCPFSYYCNISERFENSTDMFKCIFREASNASIYGALYMPSIGA